MDKSVASKIKEFNAATNIERCQMFLDFLVSIEEYEVAQEMSDLIKELKKEQENKMKISFK